MASEELRAYLEPTGFIDSDHADVIGAARRLTEGCASEREKLERIYYFVRDMPYDILASFATSPRVGGAPATCSRPATPSAWGRPARSWPCAAPPAFPRASGSSSSTAQTSRSCPRRCGGSGVTARCRGTRWARP